MQIISPIPHVAIRQILLKIAVVHKSNALVDDALIVCRLLEYIRPELPELMLAHAWQLILRGDFGAAIEKLGLVEKSRPGLARTMYLQMLAQYFSGQEEWVQKKNALNSLNESVEEFPFCKILEDVNEMTEHPMRIHRCITKIAQINPAFRETESLLKS